MKERLGKSPIEGVCGDAIDSQNAGDVRLKSIEVRGLNGAAVVVHPRGIDQLAEAAGVAERNVVAADAGVAANRGICVGQRLTGAPVMEAETQIVLWATIATASAAAAWATDVPPSA